MEKWISYDKIKADIELINSFTGGNRECVINFTGKDNKKYTLSFDDVYDFRYAIENAFIGRTANTPPETSQDISSIYIVEESEYLKNFEYGVDWTIPIEGIKHFIIFDVVDTGIEILTTKKPVLTEI